MSAVKVGDRVRATCGESVIVGTVTHIDVGGVGVDVEVPGSARALRYLFPDGWNVEVIAPPIPDVVGTIVRDKDSDAWQRQTFGWYLADRNDRSYSLKSLQRFAPLTVLWTPDVEATS